MNMLQNGRKEQIRTDAEKLVTICRNLGGEISVGDLQANHSYRGQRLDHAKYLAGLFPDLLRFETEKGKTKPREKLLAVKGGAY